MNSHFDFLSLSESLIMTVIDHLSSEEHLTLYETSKACAKMVMNYHVRKQPLPRCTVHQSTTWTGLRQVLSWIETPISLAFQKSTDCKGISAYDVFLGAPSIPPSMQKAICDNYKFPCVQEADVVGCKLRSLVPRVLAATCPNIQYCRTSVRGLITTFQQNVEQLHPCHKLKTLAVADEQAHVPHLAAMTPMPHHSVAEMVAAFPVLESVHVANGITPFVLEAFSQHVDTLHLHPQTAAEVALLQSYSKLTLLSLRGGFLVNNLLPLPAICDQLNYLVLFDVMITDSIFEQLLQLPQLDQLSVVNLNFLQHDYSKRAFKHKVSLTLIGHVQELHIFAKLPMDSFDQCMLSHPQVEIYLPDPSHPDSFAIMHSIATYIKGSSLKVFVWDRLTWVVPETDNDADAASLFSVAAPIIAMRKGNCEYDLGAVTNRPAFHKAVLDWAAPHIDHVHMLLTPEIQTPYIWQLLQRLPRLGWVTLIAEADAEHRLGREGLLAAVCEVACNAAKHLVEPAFKPGDYLTFKTEIGMPDYNDGAACDKHVGRVIEIMDETLPKAVSAGWCEVFESEWELTLDKLEPSSDAAN